MSVVAALVAGGLIGVRHSLEADHVAAVATLVDDEGPRAAGAVGSRWGVGHALPIAAAGALFLGLGTRVPAGVGTLFELLAGLALVYLGVRTLLAVARISAHNPDGDEHSHLHVGPLSLGPTRGHRQKESLLVGVVHGFAGSGAFVVLLVAAAPSPTAGAAFLVAFCAVSVAAMTALSAVWGRLVGATAGRALRGLAGVASLVVGALLLSGELFGAGLSHDHGSDDGHSHGDGHDHQHALDRERVLDAPDLLARAGDTALDVFFSLPPLW